MDDSSLEISLKDATSNLSDYSNYFDYSNLTEEFKYISLLGTFRSGIFAFIQFVETCLLISVGVPLTLWAIYGLYSQVRNGEVAPIFVINLLISDLIQFCCLIVEVAQHKGVGGFYMYRKTLRAFFLIYNYSLMVSVGFMVCIALERYLVVVHPLWYRCRRTIKSSVLVCVLVWILPASSLLSMLLSDFLWVLFVSSIFFLLPLPLLVFFLVATLRALSACISVPTEEKRRIAGMLVLVLLIYLLLFLPTIIVMVHLCDVSKNPSSNINPNLYLLINLAPMFCKLSPLADLFLYIFLRKGTIGQLWACVCRCRKESNEISSVPVNVNMSAVRDGEREGQRTEEG